MPILIRILSIFGVRLSHFLIILIRVKHAINNQNEHAGLFGKTLIRANYSVQIKNINCCELIFGILFLNIEINKLEISLKA